jgi:lipopolysaccharide transport system permease protein
VLEFHNYRFLHDLAANTMAFTRYLVEFFNLGAIAKNLYRSRDLIRLLTLRDFKARFRGSFGGALWSIIQPLIMMVIYTLVFSTFLKISFDESDSPFVFSVFLLCGLLPWSAFSEGISSATALIRGNTNLVKRVVFPLEVLPLNITLTGLIQQTIGMLLLLPLAFFVKSSLHWTILYIPLLMIIQALFYTGINWIWASLCVFLPDLKQITPLILSMLMFLTPIFYPEDRIPQWASGLITLNPLSQVIIMYRVAILEGGILSISSLAQVSLISLAFFLAGYFWFMHTKKGFADIL